jgi:outer membrane putative beta-barrel porin/alpha-amylase
VLKTTLILLAGLLMTAGTALAAHPLITDDAGTQGKGKCQLELNGETSWDKERLDGVETRESASELAAAVSIGVTETVDVVIGTPWSWSRVKEGGALVSDADGIGDISLELKWRFFEHKGFSLAVKPGVTLPTGNENRGLGTGKVSYGTALIATQKLEPFTLHVNAAYTRNEFKLQVDKEANRSDIWHGSVAATCEVAKDLHLVADVGVETNGDRGSNTWPAFILGGAIYSVTENLDLDCGIKGGLNKPEPDLTLLAGLALRF